MKIELRPFFTLLRSNMPFLKVFLVKNSLLCSYNVIEKGIMLTVALKLQHLNRNISKTFPINLFPSSFAPQKIYVHELELIRIFYRAKL